jgi:peroxiredoxin
MPKFEETGTQVLGISVDSSPANQAFAKQIGVTFPLLSDFKRTVSQDYGILDIDKGFAKRTTYVIDKNGVIQHIDVGREAIDPTGAHQACNLLEHARDQQKPQ